MMKRFVFSLLAMTVCSASAQSLHVVDKARQPVPYATIVGDDGTFIGTTDMDGRLGDVKGARVVSVSHVAYKPTRVTTAGGVRVVLDDADFGLPEITVTKKPLAYVQTYYRLLYIDDDPDTPICYYRAGVLNNAYDRSTLKVSAVEAHFSACNIGLFKTTLNTVLGATWH